MRAQTVTNDQKAWRWAERVLFAVALFALAYPITSTRFFDVLDGPSHTYVASLLTELLKGRAQELRVCELNPLPVPNSSGHVLLALLLFFMEAPDAMKTTSLICLLGLPLAVRWALVQRYEGPPWVAWVSLAFAMNLPLRMGYFNFCLGAALLMVLVGCWWRLGPRPSVIGWLLIGAVLLLLYFSHALPFVIGLGWIGLHVLELALREWRGGDVRRQAVRSYLLRAALAILPAIVLMAWYVAGSASVEGGRPDYPRGSRWEQLWRPFVLEDRWPELTLWCMAVLLMLTAFFGGGGRDLRLRPRAWAPLVLVGLLAGFLAFGNNVYGNGGDALFRVALLIHPLALLLLPIRGEQRRMGLFIALAAAGVMLGQQAVRHGNQREREVMLRAAYAAGAELPGPATAAVVHFNWERAHAPELGLANRGIIVLSNYELLHDHFPIRFTKPHLASRDALPRDTLDALHAVATNARGAELRAADYVVVSGVPLDGSQRELLLLLADELRVSHATHLMDGGVTVFVKHNRTPGRPLASSAAPPALLRRAQSAGWGSTAAR